MGCSPVCHTQKNGPMSSAREAVETGRTQLAPPPAAATLRQLQRTGVEGGLRLCPRQDLRISTLSACCRRRAWAAS